VCEAAPGRAGAYPMSTMRSCSRSAVETDPTTERLYYAPCDLEKPATGMVLARAATEAEFAIRSHESEHSINCVLSYALE
jgi:hypothetical protein